MRYMLDYRSFDNKVWPEFGPVLMFLFFNNFPADGICVDIRTLAAIQKRIARRRAYEIRDAENRILELILSQAEFNSGELKNCRVTRLLGLVLVAYGLMQGLAPEQITYPGGLYGARSEQRAVRYYMRPKTAAEIARGPEITQRLSGLAKRCTLLNGMYCLDETKIKNVYDDIDMILNDLRSERYFGVPYAPKELLSTKVIALLAGLNEPSYLPPESSFGGYIH